MMGHGEQAFESVLPLPGPNSTGDELFRLGLLYSTGQGGAPLDFISAHMLFNLAAMRGSEEAKTYRKELSREMDPADVAEAQRAARQWLAEG
jgi:TPR repeat protein